MLNMDLEYNNQILIVNLKGKLNKRNCYKINNYLNPLIKKHQIKNVILNLINLSYIDDYGIDSIIKVKYVIKNINGNLKINGYNDNIKDKIKMIGVRIKKDSDNIYA